jgi:hypothetical protein
MCVLVGKKDYEVFIIYEVEVFLYIGFIFRKHQKRNETTIFMVLKILNKEIL